MAQVLRVVALGATILAWLLLALLVIPAIEGGGSSPAWQLLIAAAFPLWLAWIVVAMRYDRRLRVR